MYVCMYLRTLKWCASVITSNAAKRSRIYIHMCLQRRCCICECKCTDIENSALSSINNIVTITTQEFLNACNDRTTNTISNWFCPVGLVPNLTQRLQHAHTLSFHVIYLCTCAFT